MTPNEIAVALILFFAAVSLLIDVFERRSGAKLKPMYVDRGEIVDADSRRRHE